MKRSELPRGNGFKPRTVPLSPGERGLSRGSGMSRRSQLQRTAPADRAAKPAASRARRDGETVGRAAMPLGLGNMTLARADWLCDRCGRNLVELGFSRQHRRAHGMGGRVGAELHTPANVVILCGSATTGCHGLVETHERAQAELDGWVIKGEARRPEDVPVLHWRHGLVVPGDGVWIPAGR